ncbi:hypothetical protein [Nonomuraea sp. NPDC049646]|uniref:hypothetical protein n=1 Tax=unclassified Nonomuraea TaxID=2593643 RepID=UPI0037A3485C
MLAFGVAVESFLPLFAQRLAGPLLLAGGLLVQGLVQRTDPPGWLVPAWAPVLFAAGAGIGLAYPHLSVAVLTGTPDPAEGGRAAAAIATVTSLSVAFGTAVAGILVNLGAASMLDSARYVLFGFAALCATGALTAHRAARRERDDGLSPRGRRQAA